METLERDECMSATRPRSPQGPRQEPVQLGAKTAARSVRTSLVD